MHIEGKGERSSRGKNRLEREVANAHCLTVFALAIKKKYIKQIRTVVQISKIGIRWP